MKKILTILIITLLSSSCSRSLLSLPAQKLAEICQTRALVYQVIPHKGGHIIRLYNGKEKQWFFTLNKHDSVQEGKWLNTHRIFPLK